MSFVDLMGGVRWTEADIVNRMEAQIREHCSGTEEMILHRKMIGAAFGFYTLTEQEQAEVAAYAQVCGGAQLAGRAARADMALLGACFEVEAARARLDAAPVEGDDVDTAARAAAHATLAGADPAALQLADTRAAARASADEERTQ